MSLPYDLDEHLDNVDAAMFSGDTFMDRENIAELEVYIGRWQREIARNKLLLLELEEE